MVFEKVPRLVIAGLRGGSGKSVLTLGLIGVWREQGLPVQPFKKGPDYIDAAWLAQAAGRVCRNLDTFLMGTDGVLAAFQRNSEPSTISLIEGNRGLFDGMDLEGSHSTAELAKALRAPLVLLVDCTKATRTVAAMVLGCREFDPDLHIAGVVLGQVATLRQENLLRKAVEYYVGVPVLGTVPRIADFPLSERHLGLLPPPEHPDTNEVLRIARETVREHVDTETLLAVAQAAGPLERVREEESIPLTQEEGRPRIGVIRDAAFNFYYPENLEELEGLGAELVFVDALADQTVPEVDLLYIGGGFPETHAAKLSSNAGFRGSLKEKIESGLPVYAECGGLTYLGDSISDRGVAHPMVGVFPVAFEIGRKPQGHGYVTVRVVGSNPYFEVGTRIRGHEFRYSRPLPYDSDSIETAFEVERGNGFDGKRGGLVYKNVLATFCHVHALGTREWANALVSRARKRRTESRRRADPNG
jgi:cobyrinic acid a,c-diamide synthase